MRPAPFKASWDLCPIRALTRIAAWIEGGYSNIPQGTGSTAAGFFLVILSVGVLFSLCLIQMYVGSFQAELMLDLPQTPVCPVELHKVAK